MRLFENFWAWLKSLGKTSVDDVSLTLGFTLIETWKRIYGNLPEWASYQTNGVTGVVTVNRKLTAASKVICSELASLIWAEQPEILVSDDMKEILKNNNFYTEMQKRIEYFAALGGIAVKGYYDGDIKLDYVTADRFIPLSYDANEVTDAQFIDNRTYGGKKYRRVETYIKTETGYTINNELYNEHDRKVPLDTIPDFSELEDSTEVTTDKKLFSYVKYPAANNLDMDSPLGISIFANSLGSLEALDIAYDASNDEVVLGRKRIIIPAAAMQVIFDETNGRFDRYFDTNDRVYQALPMEENESYKITDNSVELRIDDLLSAIDGHLRMIEMQTEFSPGSFSFDFKSGFKTATEVVSDNSKTFKTKQAAENQIDSLIKDSFEIVEAINEIVKGNAKLIREGGNEVLWDDSVIEDRNSKATYQIMLKGAGLTTQERAIMEVQGVSEEDAKTIAENVRKESQFFVDPGVE